MNAETIAHALSGRKAGSGWTARCPAHEDRTPSLSIHDTDDGRVLVRCHAGCRQEHVIAALRSRGLWTERGPRSLSRRAEARVVERQPHHDGAKRIRDALAIWQSAIPAPGTLVETYLLSRSLYLPASSVPFTPR
jgi:putative DNA primase/helicase